MSPRGGGGNELREGFGDRKTICAFRQGQQPVQPDLLAAGRVGHESVDAQLKRLDPVGSHSINLATEQGFETNGQVDGAEADRFGDLFTVQYLDQGSECRRTLAITWPQKG